MARWVSIFALMLICFLQLSKTSAVRNVLDWAAPRIYGTSLDVDSKSYTAVIIEDVCSFFHGPAYCTINAVQIENGGRSLDQLWPVLSDDQKKAVLEKIADIISVPIHMRPPADMQQPQAGSSTSSIVSSSSSVKLPPATSHIPPTNHSHLYKAYSILYAGLFKRNGEPDITAFRKRFKEYDTYELSPHDILRVKNLNTLLQEHMSEFSGGNFLPPHITGWNKESFKGQKERDKFAERRLILETILSESLFRLAHRHMIMPLFFVTFEADGITVKSVVLTQWEKAYYAPLWASCRLPSWLEPLDPELESLDMPEDEMTSWREYLVYNLMLKKERLSRSWLWYVAYTYGELERHFEMILTATWVSNAKTEPWLKRLLDEAKKKRTTAYKKGSDPGAYSPFSGRIQTMEVNFAEIMGKWMPYARTFVKEEGLLTLSDISFQSQPQLLDHRST